MATETVELSRICGDGAHYVMCFKIYSLDFGYAHLSPRCRSYTCRDDDIWHIVAAMFSFIYVYSSDVFGCQYRFERTLIRDSTEAPPSKKGVSPKACFKSPKLVSSSLEARARARGSWTSRLLNLESLAIAHLCNGGFHHFVCILPYNFCPRYYYSVHHLIILVPWLLSNLPLIALFFVLSFMFLMFIFPIQSVFSVINLNGRSR